MAKVEILSSNSNAPVEMIEGVEEAIAPQPAVDLAPTTFSFPLEGEPGEAVFNTPKIKHLRQADRLIQEQLKSKKGKAKISQVDIFRKVAELCLISWGDRSSMPPDDEIDLLDDDLMVEKILRHFVEDFSEELSEEDLVNISFSKVEKDSEPAHRILPDKSLEVDLSAGKAVFRRLTKKDIRFIETSESGSVSNSIHLAVGACIDWWGKRSKNRDLMPADLDPLPLGDFWRLKQALDSFRQKRSNP